MDFIGEGRGNMKKKYDIMWLIIMIAYIVAILLLGYAVISTILAMLQHGNQPWNLWHIIAKGVK